MIAYNCQLLRRLRLWTVAAIALSSLGVLPEESAHGAIVPRSVVKSYFQTGDTPTEGQFGNLIDSMIHLSDGGFSYVGSIPDAAALGSRLTDGAEVGPGSLFSPVAGLGEDWVGQRGFLGISLTLDSQTHYGYLQIASPPGDQYPMLVEYFVYESDPDTPIIAAHIPEPTTAVLVLTALCLAIRHRH